MAPDEPSANQTRPSLLNRLKTGDDTESWQEFYRLYGKLARDFAIQAGLTDAEADDVLQETAIAIAQHLPGYRYDPKVCRFKTWLLNQTSWRIKDALRKRKKDSAFNRSDYPEVTLSGDTSTRTATVNRAPDPAATNLDELFEAEWRKKVFEAALGRVRERFSLKQFQVFDLLVLKEWSGAEVAQSLGISLAAVYVTRHRISAAVKREAKHLEKQFEKSVDLRGAQ